MARNLNFDFIYLGLVNSVQLVVGLEQLIYVVVLFVK